MKHTIDLMKTTMKAVLQNTLKLPQWPEPAPDLAQLLEVPHTQLCDVTAFVSKVGDARTATTKNGPRNIVDVTLLDGSTTADGKTAQVSIPLFFAQNNSGDAMLAALKDAVDFATPVSFFGLLCTPHGDQASIATSPAEFSLRHCPDGTKAERLKQNAGKLKSLLQSDMQDIVRAPTWEPQSRKDWKAEPAIQSSCYLLHAALEGGAELYRKRIDGQDSGSGSQALVQLNNVRVMQPDSSGDVANLHPRINVPTQHQPFEAQADLRKCSSNRLVNNPKDLYIFPSFKPAPGGDLHFIISRCELIMQETGCLSQCVSSTTPGRCK